MLLDVIASSSAGNCYVLTAGNNQLLLDAGVKYKEIQYTLGFDTSHISGCLLTHEHG